MGDHLKKRFERTGPKRILALDGGGTRGIVAIRFLARIEALLAERLVEQGHYAYPSDFRLSHYFDLIGGTSVGSMLATMLALGMRVEDIECRFREWAPNIFRVQRTYLGWRSRGYLRSMHKAKTLRRYIFEIVGDDLLESPRLETGLGIITKRVDTNSVWVMINNPNAKYYGSAGSTEYAGSGHRNNRKYRLSDLIRASTAAPTFFPPLTMHVFDPSRPENRMGPIPWFMDGGISPHNNPALAMFMAAGMCGYRLGGIDPVTEQGIPWSLGDDNLLLVSVGTGFYGEGLKSSWLARRLPAFAAVQVLKSMTADGQELSLAWLQWLSRSSDVAWEVDSEMGDLSRDLLCHPKLAGHPLLSFQRYNINLEQKWLKENVGREFSEARLAQIRDFSQAYDIATLAQIATKAAAKQVNASHFPAAFDGVWPPPAGCKS